MKKLVYSAFLLLAISLFGCDSASPNLSGYYVIAGFSYDQIHLVLNNDGSCSNGQGSVSGNRREGNWQMAEDGTFSISGMGDGMDGKWRRSPRDLEDGTTGTFISFISPEGVAYTRHTKK